MFDFLGQDWNEWRKFCISERSAPRARRNLALGLVEALGQPAQIVGERALR
jgi:hypothetical protein